MADPVSIASARSFLVSSKGSDALAWGTLSQVAPRSRKGVGADGRTPDEDCLAAVGTEVCAVFQAFEHCPAVCPGSLQRLQRPLFGQLAAKWPTSLQMLQRTGCPLYQTRQGKPLMLSWEGVSLSTTIFMTREPVFIWAYPGDEWYLKFLTGPNLDRVQRISASGASNG